MSTAAAAPALEAKALEYTRIDLAPPAYESQVEEGGVAMLLDLLGSRNTQGGFEHERGSG